MRNLRQGESRGGLWWNIAKYYAVIFSIVKFSAVIYIIISTSRFIALAEFTIYWMSWASMMFSLLVVGIFLRKPHDIETGPAGRLKI